MANTNLTGAGSTQGAPSTLIGSGVTNTTPASLSTLTALLHPFLVECADLYDGSLITSQDYVNAANQIGCEVAAIKAVAKQEGGSQGTFRIYKNRTLPCILYEKHHFRNYTNNQYSSSFPQLSGTQGPPYGVYSAQYPKLEQAMQLNQVAALKSCSWGKFQILGSNFEDCGFNSVESMVKEYSRNEKAHLQSVVKFVLANNGRRNGLINKNWHLFAINYNGTNAPPSYWISLGNHYVHYVNHPNENP